MSALAKLRAVAGLDAFSRVKNFQNALAASDTRRARLDEQLEAAIASFQESADVAALKVAEDAVASEQKAREALVDGLAAAQKVFTDEEAEKAAAALTAKHERLRTEVMHLGETITGKLIELGRLLGRHEGIVDGLPATERYRYWPPTYCEEASRQVCTAEQMSRPGGTRTITLELTVPLAAE